MLRTVQAARYVMPFREGGSVPALVEADDLGLYVVKLKGAAQGKKALIAELVAGEIARALDLFVPEIVFVELDSALATAEPDPELAEPLEASAGINLGLDYLPGSITFDPVAGPAPDPTTASRVVLFDALVLNVDRSARNPNLLCWHRRLWLIDHGASLYVHHGWSTSTLLADAGDPYPEVRAHVLLPWATRLPEALEHCLAALTPERLGHIASELPESWLDPDDGFADAGARRAAYATFLEARLAALPSVVEEAERARAV